jgi:hypothetical protein
MSARDPGGSPQIHPQIPGRYRKESARLAAWHSRRRKVCCCIHCSREDERSQSDRRVEHRKTSSGNVLFLAQAHETLHGWIFFRNACLASNFPSIWKDVNRAIRDNPALLDPDTPLCDQMEALFLQPLRKLRLRLRGCPPLSFVIDALDECTSEPELTDLVLSLAQALRDPDLPVTHICSQVARKSISSKLSRTRRCARWCARYP